MTVHEMYQGALEGDCRSLVLLIEYLVQEKKVVKMSDDKEKLKYYLQEKFGKAINEYLGQYEKGRECEH